MPRTLDPERRQSLTEQLVDYVLTHGIADLSLRPLAAALGVSTYALSYHFGSKEALIAAVLTHIEEQQRAMTAGWLAEAGESSPAAILRRYWVEWCLPQELAPYHRLFYEIYALSLQQPARFPGFLERGAVPWLRFLDELVHQTGVPATDATRIASVMAATVSGALLILLGTGDQERATGAVEAVAETLESLTARPGEPGSGA